MTDRMTISQFKALKKKKPSKYRNEKTVVNGITFDSKKEADRYRDLKLLVAAGQIGGLQLQPVFPIVVNGVKICEYRADFSYQDAGGATVVEDCKGMRTPVYKLKKKLVEAQYGIRILET